MQLTTETVASEDGTVVHRIAMACTRPEGGGGVLCRVESAGPFGWKRPGILGLRVRPWLSTRRSPHRRATSWLPAVSSDGAITRGKGLGYGGVPPDFGSRKQPRSSGSSVARSK